MRLGLHQVRAGVLAGLVVLLAGGVTATRGLAQDPDDAGDVGDARPASAPANVNRFYFNQDLFVSKGQIVHDATCVFCSVQIEGDATGHVLVLFGNLSVTGRIDGRATVVGGNAVFDGEARVMQSTVVLFGNLVYETEDVLAGSAYVLGGHSSSFAAREGLQRRLALGPKALTALALVGLLLVVLGVYRLRQHRRLER